MKTSPPSSQGRRPGRPSNCTPETVGMLRGLIRELGLTDSAAAERIGIGVSTLSRWKREDPEVRLFLRQAREECRALHLMRIIETSQAANGKGWRASAWILERLFPEDYAPSATQREKFRALAERRREAEERQTEQEELDELMAAAHASAMGESWPDEEQTAVDLPEAGRVEKSELPTSGDPDAHGRHGSAAGCAGDTAHATRVEAPSADDAHNCRNSPHQLGERAANAGTIASGSAARNYRNPAPAGEKA